jgi:hypothetical protein
VIGTRLPDEVVAPPSALLRAGFAGIVASLWAVTDISTAMLMARFYHFWKHEEYAPDEALRQAQIWLRDSTNGEKLAYYEQFLPELTQAPLIHGSLPAEVADSCYNCLCSSLKTSDHSLTPTTGLHFTLLASEQGHGSYSCRNEVHDVYRRGCDHRGAVHSLLP